MPHESKQKKILITGFEAFGGRSMNPSKLLLTELIRDHHFVEMLVLPVHFEKAYSTFKQHWHNNNESYQAVVLLGQAAGRRGISLERVALNWMRSEKQDIDGNTVPTGRIQEDAPEAYIVDFFPDEWRDVLNQIGETHISLSAGAYVCNSLYYQVIHHLTGKRKIPVLFVHVPLLPEQISEGDSHSPTMSLTDQRNVLSKLLELIQELKF